MPSASSRASRHEEREHCNRNNPFSMSTDSWRSAKMYTAFHAIAAHGCIFAFHDLGVVSSLKGAGDSISCTGKTAGPGRPVSNPGPYVYPVVCASYERLEGLAVGSSLASRPGYGRNVARRVSQPRRGSRWGGTSYAQCMSQRNPPRIVPGIFRLTENFAPSLPARFAPVLLCFPLHSWRVRVL